MRSALQDAFRLETIDVNPMLRVKLPPVEKSDKRSLSRQEIDALLTSTLAEDQAPIDEVSAEHLAMVLLRLALELERSDCVLWKRKGAWLVTFWPLHAQPVECLL